MCSYYLSTNPLIVRCIGYHINLAKKAINVTNLTTKPGQALITAPNINTQHVLAWLQRPGPSNK